MHMYIYIYMYNPRKKYIIIIIIIIIISKKITISGISPRPQPLASLGIPWLSWLPHSGSIALGPGGDGVAIKPSSRMVGKGCTKGLGFGDLRISG